MIAIEIIVRIMFFSLGLYLIAGLVGEFILKPILKSYFKKETK